MPMQEKSAAINTAIPADGAGVVMRLVRDGEHSLAVKEVNTMPKQSRNAKLRIYQFRLNSQRKTLRFGRLSAGVTPDDLHNSPARSTKPATRGRPRKGK